MKKQNITVIAVLVLIISLFSTSVLGDSMSPIDLHEETTPAFESLTCSMSDM
jgi:hypothetical protein